MVKGYGIKLLVWGSFACFTRPEMKAERVSYDVMTPSAARGILDAIYWKPEISWVIDKIHVINPIKFYQIKRNEVGKKARATSVIFIEEERQQRSSLILRDVRYVIEAHFVLVNKNESEAKHLDIFKRRAKKGQFYHQPYLGCREFPAHFVLIKDSEDLPTPDDSLQTIKDLGWMLNDIDFDNGMKPLFFRAEMRNGVIKIGRST